MLIIFTSKYNPDIVMFHDVAGPLLRAMGQSDRPPGILRGEHIQQALTQLKTWLQHAEEKPDEEIREDKAPGQDDDDEKKPHISLSSRAIPLLDMLETAYQEKVDVIWR